GANGTSLATLMPSEKRAGSSAADCASLATVGAFAPGLPVPPEVELLLHALRASAAVPASKAAVQRRVRIIVDLRSDSAKLGSAGVEVTAHQVVVGFTPQ